jgi:ribosomal protein S3AE
MALKKKFSEVELPLLNTSVEALGDASNLVGKTIKMDLTRRLRGKSLEVIFRIYNKEGLYGLPRQLNLMKFFIIRVMRNRISYVEDSFTAKCKDVEVTMKPFLITRKRVSRAIRNNLRKTCKEFLINYVKEKTYLQVCEELLAGQLQHDMLPRLKKVYPLSFSDLRVFETKDLDKIEFVFVKSEKPKIVEKTKEETSEELAEEIKEEKVEEEKNEIDLVKEVKKEKKVKAKKE